MITIVPHTEAFVRSLDDIARQQLPYATSRALNETTKLVQLALRNHTGQIWNVKRQAWVNASIKITHFSTKYEGDLYTSIGIHPPGGDDRADILTKFETETVVLPHQGAHVVVPAGINEGRVLREGQRFSDYHFVQKGNMWRDDARDAYMIHLKRGALGVFRRVDHRVRYKRRGHAHSVNQGGSVLLFYLFPSVPIKPNLQFEAIARATVENLWSMEIEHALNDAIASAR